MIAAAPASPAPFPPACAFVRELPPDLVDASEIHQVRHEPRLSPARAQARPLSGAAIGFLRFRSEKLANVVPTLSRLIDAPADHVGCAMSILDRREFQCAWIVGTGDDGRATCCGAPVLTGKSWCREHRERVFPKGGGR